MGVDINNAMLVWVWQYGRMDISGSGDVEDVSCHNNDVLCVAGEYYAYKKRLATEHDVSI